MIGFLDSLFSKDMLDQLVGHQAGKFFADEATPTVAPTTQPPASPGFNAAAGRPAGGGSMIDSLTKILSHPLTQGLAGGAGHFLATKGSGGQRFGRGLIGGLNTMGEAQQTQRRDALAQQQIAHQNAELGYRKDIDQQRLGLQEKELEQRRGHNEMDAATRGFEPPEQRANTIARLTEQAGKDPIAAKVLPLMNPNSATPGKDFQELYKNFNNLDSQERRVEDKIESANKIAEYKAGLDRERLRLQGEATSAVQQAALARIEAAGAKAKADADKAVNEAKREQDKLENSKQTAYGKSVADFMKSDAYGMAASDEERASMLHQARTDLAQAYGLPPPKAPEVKPKEEPKAGGVKPPAKPFGKATVESVLKKFGY